MMKSKPLTLADLEERLANARKLGATGEEPVTLTATVFAGFEGLKLSAQVRAYNANLCSPATLLDDQKIINIWGIMENVKAI